VSKRSRTFQPSETNASRPPSTGSTTQGATPPQGAAAAPTAATSRTGGASRAEARRRSSSPHISQPRSFFDRYRVFIVGGAAVAVIAVVLLVFVNGAATRAYECVSFLTPPPAASAVPGSTPLPGFPTRDMGKDHVVQGASVKYDYCPPASGRHYNIGGGQAPVARRFYGPGTSLLPGAWIHNLEHGDVVILYRGDPGTEILGQLEDLKEEAAVSDWSLANCGPVNKVVVVRFDDMDPSVDFAAVAWDRAILLEEFDKQALLDFANRWQDGAQTPERVC
jgi:hypothetical protein